MAWMSATSALPVPKDWLAWGGIIGPSVFVTDWAILGATKSGYSPVSDAISRLAELGSSTRPQMTGGFTCTEPV